MQLTIGCTEWFNSFALKPFYRELMLRESSLSIKVVSAPSHTTYSMLNDSEIDVGFVCNSQARNGINTKALFRDPLVLVCNEASDWVRPYPISPECLDPAYEIGWNHLPDYRMWHNRCGMPTFSRAWCATFPFLYVSVLPIIQNFWMLVPSSVADHFLGHESSLIVQPLTDSAPDFICYRIAPYNVRVLPTKRDGNV